MSPHYQRVGRSNSCDLQRPLRIVFRPLVLQLLETGNPKSDFRVKSTPSAGIVTIRAEGIRSHPEVTFNVRTCLVSQHIGEVPVTVSVRSN